MVIHKTKRSVHKREKPDKYNLFPVNKIVSVSWIVFAQPPVDIVDNVDKITDKEAFVSN